MEKKKNNYLVVKSNTLIRQRTNLSLSEMKIILFMIQAIDQEDNLKGEFKNSYTLDIQDFITLEETKNKNELQRAKEITLDLLKKAFTIRDKETTLQTHWISSVKYKEGSSIVEFSFDSNLKPYLLNIKKNFTAYDIRCLLRLKSGYSIVMYELIRSYKTQGSFIIGVEELKHILNVQEKYKRFYDFKKYALDKAKKETAKYCDLTFDYTPFEKIGKKVISLEIGVYTTKNKTPQEALPEQEHYSLATTVLIRYGIPSKRALEIYEKKGEELLTAILNKWSQSLEKGKTPSGQEIKSTRAMLEWAIENEDKETELEREKREQQEQQELEYQARQKRQQEEQKRLFEESKRKEEAQKQARIEYANTSASEMTACIIEKLKHENEKYQNLSQEIQTQLEQFIFEMKDKRSSQIGLYTDAKMFLLKIYDQEEEKNQRDRQIESFNKGLSSFRSVVENGIKEIEKEEEKKKQKKRKNLF